MADLNQGFLGWLEMGWNSRGGGQAGQDGTRWDIRMWNDPQMNRYSSSISSSEPLFFAAAVATLVCFFTTGPTPMGLGWAGCLGWLGWLARRILCGALSQLLPGFPPLCSSCSSPGTQTEQTNHPPCPPPNHPHPWEKGKSGAVPALFPHLISIWGSTRGLLCV